MGFEILVNIMLLLTLSVVYATFPFKTYRKLISHVILVGTVVGFIGIFIMLNPVVIQDGLIFDSRTILISVSAMVFGFFPAFIGSCIMAIYRVVLGGSGTITGVSTIVLSLSVGSLWHRFRYKKVVAEQHHFGLEYYLVGLVTHIGMLLCLIFLPNDIQGMVFGAMALPILLYYPIGSYLLCLLLFSQTHRLAIINDLRRSERQFKTIFEQAPIGMSLTDLTTGKISNINQSYLDLLGMPSQEVLGKSWSDFTHPDDLALSATITEKMRHGETGPFNFDKRFIKSDGTVVWSNLSLCVFEPNDEDTLESLCMTLDISERKNEENRVLYASNHDRLTGLYNRTHFEERLRNFKSEDRLPLTVAFGDVNGLRIINEAFGREQGNLLLQEITSIIKERLGENSYASRVGGDEIALIFFSTPLSEAELIIQDIRSKVSEMMVMHSVRTSISFGLCEMTSASDDINEVIKLAEKDVGTRKLIESPHMRGRAVYAIINTLHEKNKREELHSRRVSTFCEALAKASGMSDWQISEMKLLGLMHDIGKIAISEAILNKDGKLTSEEWKEMKRHSEIGYRILSSVEDMTSLAVYVLAHHERLDGKGYPKGLMGDEIPLQSKIIAIADSFDAMTGERTYRKGILPSEAATEIKRCAGTQFDPALARIFVEKVLNLDWDSLA